MLGNFSCFYCRLSTFSKLTYSNEYFRIAIRVSNGLDLDQDRHNVGPDLGPNLFFRGYMYKMTKITAFLSEKLSFGTEKADVFMQLRLTKITDSSRMLDAKLIYS